MCDGASEYDRARVLVGISRDGLKNVWIYAQMNAGIQKMPAGRLGSVETLATSSNDVCAAFSLSAIEPSPLAISCLGIYIHAYINVMLICDSHTWLSSVDCMHTHTDKPEPGEDTEQYERPVDVGDLSIGWQYMYVCN